MTQRQGGFTLIELLVVLAIMAISLSAVHLALRDNDQQLLEKQAQQLQAQLEKARAISRTSGQTCLWQPNSGGYRISCARSALTPESNSATSNSASSQWQINWLLSQTQVSANTLPVLLGPEPVIAPTRITLSVKDKPQLHISLETDGVSGFEVRP
jgi:general secretion pathway protein H